MLASSLWHSMALLLDALCKTYKQKCVWKQEVLDSLYNIADLLNHNKFKKEDDFLVHVVNCGF